MKTGTIILLAVGGIAGLLVLKQLMTPSTMLPGYPAGTMPQTQGDDRYMWAAIAKGFAVAGETVTGLAKTIADGVNDANANGVIDLDTASDEDRAKYL